ncbi:PEP/pyruvate-binding domain-containing protein [Streptomyces sp. NPDC058683]|uniref:PEP/pyruvate-binding domain-containing protein n=1 Tax=Streptomyces sp. NPDC058683 TaxID=3346597 RepID=UPI0036580763
MTTLDERHGLVGAQEPLAVPLDRPLAALPLHAGSKAANLARAAGAGLPVLPGFVIPDGAFGDTAALRRAWLELSGGGDRPLVVRSSSPQEDTRSSSLAGQFASVLEVRGWADFGTAVRTVRDSARRPDGTVAPMAVLVQPMLTARVGGVMFGADPLAGRADRLLVSAVRGGPDRLVSGELAGNSYWLSRRGRLLRTEPSDAGAVLTRGELVRLARRARRVFAGPQDIEFGFDGDGRLWLFQSRPITAMAKRPSRGARLLGPGPVAETLPGQLLPLEADLWVTPMARGLTAALDIGGSAPRRLLRTVPVVTTVGGRAAADLRLLGAAPPAHRWLALLNPAPGARRLAAAWRLGRLSAALPGLATDLAADVDRHLAGIPAPARLHASGLVAELRWTRAALVSLHAQEALAGALLPGPAKSRTAAGAALAALAETRAQGVPDVRAATAAPVILTLTAPGLRGTGRLPGGTEETAERARLRPVGGAGAVAEGARPGLPDRQERPLGGAGPVPSAGAGAGLSPVSPTAVMPLAPVLPPREALRLRVRWVQELQVRLVREAAWRLGVAVERVGMLRWPELIAVLEGAAFPADAHARVPEPESPPLPDAFRLADGEVVAERTGSGAGRGVSGGRAVGTVWDGSGPRPADAVLVVRTLDPALAPLLPVLTGLVAQTGSPLSHLAVLAREYGVPAVVGAADAVGRFPPGSRIAVDGTSGDVRRGGE